MKIAPAFIRCGFRSEHLLLLLRLLDASGLPTKPFQRTRSKRPPERLIDLDDIVSLAPVQFLAGHVTEVDAFAGKDGASTGWDGLQGLRREPLVPIARPIAAKMAWACFGQSSRARSSIRTSSQILRDLSLHEDGEALTAEGEKSPAPIRCDFRSRALSLT